MRLTLRTLLAYLDDILEPSQAKEIGDKVNESSFASSLVSRIREVMRRRRLTAPTLSGPGVGIDPNTVAEYLDNTLPPDGVADVEKICLESDVHLAEVAACHQILTLALGEPVEIPQPMREKMYAFGPSAEKVELAPANQPTPGMSSNGLSNRAVGEILAQAPNAKAASPAGATQRVEIPEYLRSHSNFKRLLGYTAVAVLVICWGVYAIKQSPFLSGGRAKNQGDQVPVAVDDGRGKPADGSGNPQPGDRAVAANGTKNKAAPEPPAAESGDKPENAGTKPKELTSIDLPAPDELADEPGAGQKRKSKVLTPSSDADETEPSVADKVEAANKNKVEAGPDSPAVTALAVPPAKYITDEGATLEYRGRDERWFKIPPRSFVHTGDILAVPEPFQCTLEVDGGKGLVTVLGGSWMRILDPTDAGVFGIELRRGKMFVRPASANNEAAGPLRLGVGIAGELWRVEAPPGTVVGVQINLMEPTKLEQELDNNAYMGAFYVSTGAALLVSPGGKEYSIRGPGWLELPLRLVPEGEKPTQNRPLMLIPKWMTPEPLTKNAQNYSRIFASKFSLDDAVELSIPDVAEDANPEIARLATECLGLIEAYGPLVDILHRSQHEEARKAAISGLRLWLPRDPANKDRLKAELDKQFPPEEAETVYRLLWGFNADDARDEKTSRQLVDWMGDPEIWIRELAFYHVSRLTEKRHDYRPNASLLQLKSTLKRWDEHLKREKGLLPPLKPVPNPQ
jgi:hypothetical protein